jgi:hypothetical protein
MVNILIPPIPKPPAALHTAPHCELPDEHGQPCQRPAKRVILINQFPAAVCAPCAEYVETILSLWAKTDGSTRQPAGEEPAENNKQKKRRTQHEKNIA